jgi:MCP family monocarboxylic acid transporter-like MFS transporter 10
MTYVPSMSIVSHYFKHRRTLALGIAASGSSLGGMLHPIMLNRLFHGSVGFHNGVRASAGLNLALLVIAIALTRPRLPPRQPIKFFSNVGSYARDLPYVFMTIGASLVVVGIYITIFFLQLMTIENGITPAFAFYMITIMNGANVVGRVLPNMLAHRFGVFTVLVPYIAACGILILNMPAVKNVTGTVVFATLFGFFSGACVFLFKSFLHAY